VRGKISSATPHIGSNIRGYKDGVMSRDCIIKNPLKLPLLLTPLTGTPDRYIHVGNPNLLPRGEKGLHINPLTPKEYPRA
jgi:hypothetical protein